MRTAPVEAWLERVSVLQDWGGARTCLPQEGVSAGEAWTRFDLQLTELHGGSRDKESGGSESGTASPRPLVGVGT